MERVQNEKNEKQCTHGKRSSKAQRIEQKRIKLNRIENKLVFKINDCRPSGRIASVLFIIYVGKKLLGVFEVINSLWLVAFHFQTKI